MKKLQKLICAHLRNLRFAITSDGKGLTLFFDDLLDAKVREINPALR
ncbi:hypothetical protein [Desulfonatronum thiosulfatophilum]|nr:hypothetical protein [Desulfonatronum thiosulfatophilum]